MKLPLGGLLPFTITDMPVEGAPPHERCYGGEANVSVNAERTLTSWSLSRKDKGRRVVDVCWVNSSNEQSHPQKRWLCDCSGASTVPPGPCRTVILLSDVQPEISQQHNRQLSFPPRFRLGGCADLLSTFAR